MGRNLLTPIVSNFLSLTGLFLLSLPAKAITINFSNPATDELSEINALGLGISGSGNIDFSGGLGIGNNGLVDKDEFITFSFIDSLASSVGTLSAVLTLDGSATTPGTGTIEAFGIGGASLGIVDLNSFTVAINVSSLFNNQLLSSFKFTANQDTGRNFAQISFNPIPNEVPEPSFLLALGAIGLAGIRGLRSRRN